MYAIKFHGMYVRALDGGMTDNKQSVKLFDTIEMATEYAKTWAQTSQVHGDKNSACIVEVETKLVMKKEMKSLGSLRELGVK
jgi:hypothetical protein